MIKLRALKKKLSSGFDGNSKDRSSVATYETKHRDVKSTRSSLRRRAIPSTRHVETDLPPLPTQEYTITKEKPSTHEQILKEKNFNRKQSERYYIYDFTLYRGPTDESATSDPTFDIFQKKEGINPTSARYVIHYLTRYFKETLIDDGIAQGSRDTGSIKSAIEIFKPNLSHFSNQEIEGATRILKSFFPWDGCSLNGKVLEESIKKSFGNHKNKLILALRIIWSHLPQGIIPWEAYLKFCAIESKQNFSKMCFYNFLPRVLPDHDYTCCAFEFLEILVAIISKVDMVVDKYTQMDLIFTAGQVCFVSTPDLRNYIKNKSSDSPDLIALVKVYQAKGEALYRLFVSYLRSLVEEGKIKDFYLIDTFQIDDYPPKPYKPMTQRALTLTVPQLPNPDENNFNELMTLAAKASTRIYSSNHTFTKMDNTFLDKFEEDPYKVVTSLFSRSSKRYMYKFDDKFDPEIFKNFGMRSGFGSGLQSLGPGDQYAVATWINSCKDKGFNDFLSVLDDNNFGEGTLALGSSNFKSAKDEAPAFPPVRVSKMDVSEWFISSWKYETFLSKVKNTLVIKLTKRIADCEWLVITTDERVGSQCYLTPCKSGDSAKEQEWSKFNTPPLPSKDRTPSHTASPSISSTKSRPPPPSLLGEPSSSPLIDSSLGLYPENSSFKSHSRRGSHNMSPRINVAKQFTDRRSVSSIPSSNLKVEKEKAVQSTPRSSEQVSDSLALDEIPEDSTKEQEDAGPQNSVENSERDNLSAKEKPQELNTLPKEENEDNDEEVATMNDASSAVTSVVEPINFGTQSGAGAIRTIEAPALGNPESLANSQEEPVDKIEVESNKNDSNLTEKNSNQSINESGETIPKEAARVTENLDMPAGKDSSSEHGEASPNVICTPRLQIIPERSEFKEMQSIHAEITKENTFPEKAPEAGLLSPLILGTKVVRPSPMGTPVDRAPPGHLPKGPMKIQNPSISSFADTTAVSSGGEDNLNSTETTQVSSEQDETSPDKKGHPYSVMLLPESPVETRERAGISAEDEAMIRTNMTGDLLSDLLDNYNTISVDPRFSSEELTVFERVRMLYERQNAKAAARGSSSGDSLHEDADLDTSPESSDADLGSSKTATWFSCNVTLPTTTKRAELNNKQPLPALHLATPHNRDKLRRVSTCTSEFPDDDGLWPDLDCCNELGSSEEVCSPSHSMIKNVVLRTKRSIRGLRDKKQVS
ncbi:LAFE_0C02278g1_1 [Lachancea fermentati]|uniref:LAFE_0C02278g1_1 n=1 Tax=Lachancea fermentati TaxID=4955 RepID=A0A1G4M944_LACFM|nr:LAFE_0C02278g1_1 [Lachancea fermentati]